MAASPSFRLAATLALLFAVPAACAPPADPDGTTETVRGSTLILGWIAGVPQDGAVEIEAARRLADRLDAELRILEAPIHTLIDRLEDKEVHVIAGDLPETSPLSSHYAMSTGLDNVTFDDEVTARVMAIRKGENGFLMRLNTAIEDRS